MDHSVDEELAGWLCSKTCRQWLDVQAETSDEKCLSGVNSGTSVSIFVSNMDGGIEYILSKSANDTKLCGAVDMM